LIGTSIQGTLFHRSGMAVAEKPRRELPGNTEDRRPVST
jgi:hypothetical protein